MFGIVSPAIEKFEIGAAGLTGSLEENIQALLDEIRIKLAQQLGAPVPHPFRSGLLGGIAAALMVQRHGRGHRQIADREIHNPLARLPQLQHKGLRRAIHQGTVAAEAYHKETSSTIPATDQVGHLIGEHLIA